MLSSEYLDHFMKDDLDLSLSSTQESSAYVSLVVLHLGVLQGSFDAAQTLGYRYMNGIDVPEDTEAAAYYYSIAVRRASDFFHKVGGQPIVEVIIKKKKRSLIYFWYGIYILHM